ncbi:MAG TPA: polysaccharide pyruvyl transferase family protein [Bacillus sp. (in: firmicutes)]|nr:polysaccharide pyruvyl transferase family protein [Bacillus sp. (in: firmicutes)]
MSQIITTLKAKIPFRWKLHAKYLLSEKITPSFSKDDPKVIVALAADYGNLGDVAITKAQITFIKDAFPNHKIVTVYLNEINSMLVPLKKLVNSKDIITIIGGGNMGDLYEVFEEQRRGIISFFPDNKIISFPQTIDFTKSTVGEQSLHKTIEVYSKHPNLHVFAREPQSFEIMKECFKANHVYQVPDIVLYLNKANPELKRDGIILCLREDAEQKISNKNKQQLLNSITETYKEILYYDTHIGDENYSKEQADIELDKIWDCFKKSKVVVTDRLHGMIFCAITKTPCVVLPNSNHKIAGTYYKWLSDLKYIKFFEEYDEKLILKSINQLYLMDLDNSKSLNIGDKYSSLLNALKN